MRADHRPFNRSQGRAMHLRFANVTRLDIRYQIDRGVALMLCMPRQTVNDRLTSRCYSGPERRAKRS